MSGAGEVGLSFHCRSRWTKVLDWTGNYSAFEHLRRIF